jgi:hypothetical protein
MSSTSSISINRVEFAELWCVIKLVLVLLHGNVAAESGFSVNGDMLVENLHEPSLVAQRMAFDSIESGHTYPRVIGVGGVMGVVIDKRLLQYV